MDVIGSAVNLVLGLDRSAQDLSVGQMSARAIVVFFAGLAIVRVGNRRFLGKTTPFDVMLGFVLGSVLSRAISGTAAFVPTIVSSLVIVMLHRLLAALVFRAHRIGVLVKGQPLVIIEDGALHPEAAARARLTPGDLAEALRMRGVRTVPEVALATVERNGFVSVIPRAGGVGTAPHEGESPP